jgi:hypothetical protein
MADGENKLESLMKQLEAERDELKVQFSLAKLEAREDWEEIEKKMEAMRGRMKVVGDEAKEATGDVGTAVSALGEEIKEGFARIRKLL